MRRSATVRANEIRLKRQQHKGCFLVVEGREDRLFIEQFIDPESCSVIVAGGKDNVIDTIGILETDCFRGVAGIVDADFDHMEGEYCISDNIITLETVDLEALLIRSSALDRVMVRFGSSEKIGKFDQEVREVLLAAALPIGCLRLHSLRAGLKLTFRRLKYPRFLDVFSLTVDIESMVKEVMNRSKRPDLSWRNLAQEIVAIQRSVDDQWLICYGTDMLAVLAHGLRKALGTNNARAVGVETVRMCLQLGFQWSDLNRSKLGGDLRKWSDRHPGFPVLRDQSNSE